MTMWKFDGAFMSNLENQRAIKDVAAGLAAAPSRSCRRS
jgi:hypothetical protein